MQLIPFPRRPPHDPWWLTILRGPFGRQSFYLRPGHHVIGAIGAADITFGRAATLTHGIAGHELLIFHDDRRLTCHALSAHPIGVNDEGCIATTLEDGDRVTLGAGHVAARVSRGPIPGDVPATLGVVCVREGGGRGGARVVHLRAGDTLVGSAPECHIQLSGKAVAMHHTVIRVMGPITRVINLHPTLPIEIDGMVCQDEMTLVAGGPGPVQLVVGDATLDLTPPPIWPAGQPPRARLGRWVDRAGAALVVSRDPYELYSLLLEAVRQAGVSGFDPCWGSDGAGIDLDGLMCVRLVAPTRADRDLIRRRRFVEPWVVLRAFDGRRPMAPRRALIDGPEMRSLLRQASRLPRVPRRREAVRHRDWVPLVGS